MTSSRLVAVMFLLGTAAATAHAQPGITPRAPVATSAPAPEVILQPRPRFTFETTISSHGLGLEGALEVGRYVSIMGGGAVTLSRSQWRVMPRIHTGRPDARLYVGAGYSHGYVEPVCFWECQDQLEGTVTSVQLQGGGEIHSGMLRLHLFLGYERPRSTPCSDGCLIEPAIYGGLGIGMVM